MAGITTRNLDDPFEDRIVGWLLADSRACARIMEDRRRRNEPLNDGLPDAVLAASASHRLALTESSTDEPRGSGVAIMDRWTVGPR